MKIDVTEGFNMRAVRNEATHQKTDSVQSVLQQPEDMMLHTTADNPD